jgi:glycosyltransferase involved in cell wall biosynthesis
MSLLITGINIVRNCIENGYPFIESVLSTLPLCDEYLINDGGSTDGTLEALLRLSKNHPKLRILTISDTPSVRWDCVSNQINIMIKKAGGKWLFLGNADELLHERDVPLMRNMILHNRYRILRFDRYEISDNWGKLSTDVYHPARVALNDKGVRQDWNAYGGDEFLYDDGWYDPHRMIRSGCLIYHLYNIFPENRINKLKNDAEWLSPGDKQRVKMYQGAVAGNYTPPKNVYPGLPALAKGLAGMPKYQIREELFDKEWLKEKTGLDY